MYHRDQRPFPYDDQNTTYPSGHIPNHGTDYPSTGYAPQDASGHYYVAPAHEINGGTADSTNPSSPYFRSMTPSLVSANRYPNPSRPNDPRYYSSQGSQGYGSSASASSSQPMYSSQQASYPSQYHPGSDQRALPQLNHRNQPQVPFIPTPSEIAHSYSNYPQGARSPGVPENPYSSSSLDYPAPPHMVPSSHAAMHGHRPSRILTGRPRTPSGANSASPPSASSPSGERFLCEKCGKTFSRSHDRKRHHETQHTPIPVMHTCHHCQKEFSR
ncbi:hypothetical protein BDN70DRAFT_930184 [Pholiota conissans]|uniref:C2H2-type domain-containing protein n=1 Tax=Pholiota conissans TaxID=109636 RepID=A0A9P5Z729_9AGAR|nr:hypothetical protein BDN70DRAFT_930184 [Pholiota conissans]